MDPVESDDELDQLADHLREGVDDGDAVAPPRHEPTPKRRWQPAPCMHPDSLITSARTHEQDPLTEIQHIERVSHVQVATSCQHLVKIHGPNSRRGGVSLVAGAPTASIRS